MLNLTLNEGESLQIGDDIRVTFQGSTSTQRMKVGVDAPKEKNIARIPAAEKKLARNIVVVKSTSRTGIEDRK